MKADLIGKQEKALTEYRDEYSRLLREERDGEYRRLLDTQRDERATLRQHQEDGVRSYELLDLDAKREGDARQSPKSEQREDDWASLFRAAAEEICDQRGGYLDLPEIPEITPAENSRTRDGTTMATWARTCISFIWTGSPSASTEAAGFLRRFTSRWCTISMTLPRWMGNST